MTSSRAALADYEHLSSGKVREIYRIDDELLLMVASDRISAYDFILPSTIEDKGRVLTAMSVFWFELLADVIPNHIVSLDDRRIPAEVLGRGMVVRSLDMFDVECVARGYLSGSGWAEYGQSQAVCGVPLPAGLRESGKLPEPIFTPATKAAFGDHDENVSFEAVAAHIGADRAGQLRDATLTIYGTAADHAATRGILLADTKFEFGLDRAGQLVLGDEVLTPDSSRFWPADQYRPGGPQPSFDKQFVRDYLTSAKSGWDRTSGAQPPTLPADVVAATRDRYIQAYEKISGRSFADWPGGE